MAFARQLDPGTARTIFSSGEPKAFETARALAGEWGLSVEAVCGLHEHERPQAQLLSREEFDARVRLLFDRPAELVFGAETAGQAGRRFTTAVMRLISASTNDVVLVSHGTVMTLFAANVAGVEPFSFWKAQDMPCAMMFSIPELELKGGILRPPSSDR